MAAGSWCPRQRREEAFSRSYRSSQQSGMERSSRPDNLRILQDLQEEKDHIVTQLPERRFDKKLKQTENQTAAHLFSLETLGSGLHAKARTCK